MSRPQEASRAAERAKARDALDRITPGLAALRRAIRDHSSALTSAGAERLLCDLFYDLELAEDDFNAQATLAEAGAVDPAATAMLAYAKANRVASNVAAVRTEVERMATAANNKQAKALLNLIVAASQSPKVPTYTEVLLDGLLAAGLTNGITAAQRKAILPILSDPNFGKGKRVVAAPVGAAGPQPVVPASWAGLPNPVPGFKFVKEKVHQNVLNRAVLDAGLPPATSIDFFAPGGSFELASIEGDRDKAIFVWKSIKGWLNESGKSDPRLDMHRQPAWVFLLGHVHGYLTGVKTIEKVRFASPWASDEVIYATRMAEKPVED